MAAKRPAKAASEYHTCTCGDRHRIPMTLTETSKLARRYLEKKQMTQADLARKIGRSEQAVGFFFSGQGGRPYLGRRAGRRGEVPLAFQIKKALGIPDKEFAEASLEDEMRLAGMAWNRCSPHSVLDQRISSRKQPHSGRLVPLEATSAA